MKSIMLKLVPALLLLAGFWACNKNGEGSTISNEALEVTQQVGDFMASVDEFGGNTHNITSLEKSIRRDFERHAPGELFRENLMAQLLLPEAWAASCSTAATYSACSSEKMTKTFSACTIGQATFNGTIALAWSNSSTCTLGSSIGAYITRNPNLTVTGRLGSTLTIAKTNVTGDGQKLELSTSGSPKTYFYTSDGIDRKFTNSEGRVTMNFTSSTNSAITITGGDRVGRKMSGGAFRVVNNINNVSCNFAPTDVTWTADCNCPTSGTWAGSCSDGYTVSVSMNGCGTATVTYDDVSESIQFDRCGD